MDDIDQEEQQRQRLFSLELLLAWSDCWSDNQIGVVCFVDLRPLLEQRWRIETGGRFLRTGALSLLADRRGSLVGGMFLDD